MQVKGSSAIIYSSVRCNSDQHEPVVCPAVNVNNAWYFNGNNGNLNNNNVNNANRAQAVAILLIFKKKYVI